MKPSKTKKPTLFVTVKETKRGKMNARVELIGDDNKLLFKKTFLGLNSYNAMLVDLSDYQETEDKIF